MMDWYDGGGIILWAWMLMGLCMVLFFGFVAWLVVSLTRGGPTTTKRPEEILDERYARGDIGTDEYQQRRGELSRH